MTATKKIAATLTLAEDTYAIGIHGVTGQQIDEGDLCIGTPVRNVRVERDGPTDAETVYRFEASTDGGRTWYTQETYGRPITA
jgi:hypothetical protein